MNFQDFIQHQRVLGEYIVSLYFELSKIAQKSVTRETREKLFKVVSSFTEARRDFLDNDRELRDMGKFPYEMHSIFASGVRYAIRKFDFLNRQVRIDFGIELKKDSLDTRILSRYKYIAEMDSLSPLEQYEKRNILRHSKTLKGGLIRNLEYSLNDLETEIRTEFPDIEYIKERYNTASSILMQYLNEFPKEDNLVENFNFLQICYRMVRFGKFSRVAPKEVKVKDYEEINGKWVPKINTRQVDSNSIRKVENVTIPELKKIVKFTGSVGETAERKNENVHVDVWRKLNIEVNQLREKNEQFKARLEQTTKDWQIAEKKAATAYTKEAGVELCEVHAELELLRKQIKEDAQARIELEGNIQHLRNELTFKEKFHSEEINELRTGLSKQYETILQQSLQELREQHEGKMRKMEMLYEQKIKDLQAEANRESVAASRAIEELDVSHQNIESLYIRISKLEATNAALNGRNSELGKLLANERRRHTSDIAKVDAELQLRDEVIQQLQESVAYEKLLYDEENLSQGKYVVTTREIAKYEPKVTVTNKGTNEVQVDGRRFKCKIAPVSQWNVTSAAHEPSTNIVMKSLKWQIGKSIKTSPCNADEEEVTGADGIKHTIIRHVSNHRIINEESSSGEKNPLRRKWIYHVFHRGKRSPHPSWLLKVLGAIT
ncbi:lamin-C-like [Musca autumnalis]|uniref:lamin-C-like n=1 Tax=Musca autumnalis TaxID=221902 RepID=UPI003CEBFE8E